MDLPSIAGLLIAFGLVVAGILNNGTLASFFDTASVLIVVLGTMAILVLGFPMATVKGAVLGARRAFQLPAIDSAATVRSLSELSQRARREGLLSLEAAAEESDDEFLARGLQLMVDGHEPATIESVLFDQIAKTEERRKQSVAFWEGMGTFAPAMGMIGTLIGLVQMLGKLEDPSAIGPAMSVALLTTFYGSLMANLIGLPIANRLKLRAAEEVAHMELMAQGMLSILAGENPRFMVERLNATLPPEQRLDEAA